MKEKKKSQPLQLQQQLKMPDRGRCVGRARYVMTSIPVSIGADVVSRSFIDQQKRKVTSGAFRRLLTPYWTGFYSVIDNVFLWKGVRSRPDRSPAASERPRKDNQQKVR